MSLVRTAVAPLAFVALLAGALPLVAQAGPTDPVVVELPPANQGPAFVPGVRLVAELPNGYVEEEYFVSGESTLFNYAHNPPLGPTDIVPVQEDVPYKTRMIVRRPGDATLFNGTVVIEWWNSTAGFDTAPVWDPSAEYFTERGIVYVGVTNSTTSLGFLVNGCRLLGLLPPACGTRYATLSLPENGLAYEMMSQIANLLKSDDPGNPLADLTVERVLHAGESQQGGSMVTYASAFHLPGVNGGYFVQSASFARPINFGPACGAEGSPPFPSCTPRLAFPANLVRTDLPVPVYQAIMETDLALLFGTLGRQPDTPTYRYYEVAGAAHLTVHKGIEIIPAGVFGPGPVLLEDLCQNELNTAADGPVFASFVLNALWQRMQEQLIAGSAPPAGVLMDAPSLSPPSLSLIARDAFGNALGGVRLPSMEVPTASYFPTNVADPTLPPALIFIGNLACFLGGSAFPFDAATLDALYPSHGSYVSQVGKAANALRAQGLMLADDAEGVKQTAGESAFGK